MRVLFLHDRFPGQFRHLAGALAADPTHDVRFAARVADGEVPGVEPLCFRPARDPHGSTHHYLRPLEAAVLNGQAAYRACAALKRRGFVPDIVYSHAGFGPGLFVLDAFTDAPYIGYFERYYHGRGGAAELLVPAGHGATKTGEHH